MLKLMFLIATVVSVGSMANASELYCEGVISGKEVSVSIVHNGKGPQSISVYLTKSNDASDTVLFAGKEVSTDVINIGTNDDPFLATRDTGYINRKNVINVRYIEGTTEKIAVKAKIAKYKVASNGRETVFKCLPQAGDENGAL